ncbi:MAG: tRNA (adenosine(37)-N6)-dimethylallyltransferase MiaA [Planctomycetes bacterium]|jgi:tRNA dimethylallyltransferase|nr:tRNA (adenosine(37)-N6)-dimethylallyltransferase MiaA [Phycisphaerae bacterium]NBB94487.1 tRNA (adenosine(37)-N6)-dimethylallyltransferase MiaA [Planctomycetota bacterium]
MIRAYFILGCTACGKGSAGREVARRLGAEIISVDSMKVYRRMDIGTAKPSAEARAEIPHHAVDVVEPAEASSVAQWVALAEAAIDEIRRRGRPALCVGGTSLYIKAVRDGLFEGCGADEAIRARLTARVEAEGTAELHRELAAIDPASADRIHPNDAKRIIRALEVHKMTGRAISELQQQWESQAGPRDDIRLIGLRRNKADQSRRINARVKRMVDMGLLDEVRGLLAEPAGLSDQAAQAVGYAEIIDHLAGRCSFEKAVEQIKINTRRLAKKQRTWMRRWPEVTWLDLAGDEATDAIADRILMEIDRESRPPKKKS